MTKRPTGQPTLISLPSTQRGLCSGSGCRRPRRARCLDAAICRISCETTPSQVRPSELQSHRTPPPTSRPGLLNSLTEARSIAAPCAPSTSRMSAKSRQTRQRDCKDLVPPVRIRDPEIHSAYRTPYPPVACDLLPPPRSESWCRRHGRRDAHAMSGHDASQPRRSDLADPTTTARRSAIRRRFGRTTPLPRVCWAPLSPLGPAWWELT